MFTKDHKKVSAFRTKLSKVEELQAEVLEAIKAVNVAPLSDIGKAEENLLGRLYAWKSLANEFKGLLGRMCSQQLANMNRQSGPEFYCSSEGLACKSVDVTEMSFGSLTPTAMTDLVDKLFAIGHVHLGQYCPPKVNSTTLFFLV